MPPVAFTVRSSAKVNWSLRVLGRRADGYHDLESLVSEVTLWDELSFTDAPPGTCRLECSHADVPPDDRNLIVRAARLLAERTNCELGMACRLVKSIPVGGGLGGGSSNAAATLLALNRLWSLGLSGERLSEVAAELGSDVPFFLTGGSAVISGRGEHVRPVRVGWRGWVALVFPPFSMSTASVYAAWRSNGSCAEIDEGRVGRDARDWMSRTFNMLEEPAMTIRPALREIRDCLQRLADRPVRMSGSGSTLFTAFDTREEADRFCSEARTRADVAACVVELVEKA